jgi:two-component system sensor histidine kinase ChvG
MGVYDRFEIRRHGSALESLASELARDPGADLDAFAERHGVLIRVIGTSSVVSSTRIEEAEGRLVERGWFRRTADVFFGPSGPPDLAAFEATLPAVFDRDEVQSAMRGVPMSAERVPAVGNMFVFYRAAPRPDGSVVYLTRVSRRSVRSLYDSRFQLLKLTLVLSAGALVMGLWVGWSVVSPLIRLSSRVRTYLERGRGAELALDRSDEIGALSRDIAELAGRLEHRVEETARVTADFAHDLKNPIAALAACRDLLESSEAIEGERRGKLSSAVGRAVAHLSRSVDGMLELARLDEALGREPKETVDLAAVAAEVADLDPRIEVTAVPAVMVGNRARLEELLRNLADNALVFAKERVRIDVEPGRVSVSDDGPGVSEGNRDKIFARFFTVRPDGAPKGNGLGLSIARAIAEAHDGEVTLEREGTLGGATFTVRFPA